MSLSNCIYAYEGGKGVGEIKISGVGSICTLQGPPIQIVGIIELCIPSHKDHIVFRSYFVTFVCTFGRQVSAEST